MNGPVPTGAPVQGPGFASSVRVDVRRPALPSSATFSSPPPAAGAGARKGQRGSSGPSSTYAGRDRAGRQVAWMGTDECRRRRVADAGGRSGGLGWLFLAGVDFSGETRYVLVAGSFEE